MGITCEISYLEILEIFCVFSFALLYFFLELCYNIENT